MRSIGFLAIAAMLVPGLAHAQEPADRDRADPEFATAEGLPDGWLMRLDRDSFTPDMVDFEPMEPGWHVKTGRAAGIFWQADAAFDDEYATAATYHLFDPAEHAEAFGLFVGGTDLDGPDQQYVYFLVRQTGEYLIKRRTGSETSDIVDWTQHPAVPVAPTGEQGPTQYDLAISVGAGEVSFMVNGQTVHSLPVSEVDTDGVYGLRINHMLDVHVEDFGGERRP